MTYYVNHRIHSFSEINWSILGPIKVVHCINNELTSFQYLPDSVEEIYCDHNNITSFQYLPSSIKKVFCFYNKITSFQYLPNTVEMLYCIKNKINNFKYFPINVEYLYCSVKSFDHLYYIPDKFVSSLGILNIETIRWNRWKDGLEILKKVNREIKAKIIQKLWQRWWYEGEVSRFCLYSMKLMK